MERLYVGTYSASISSPHGLTDQQRWQYARSYLSVLEERLSHKNLPIKFQLLYTASGCIKLKAKVFIEYALAGTVAVLGALMLAHHPAVKEELQSAGVTYPCKVGEESWECKVLKCDVNIAAKIYVTQPDDTLDRVIKQVWQVPAADQKMVANAVRDMNPAAFLDIDKGVLAPGKPIAQLDASMCRVKK